MRTAGLIASLLCAGSACAAEADVAGFAVRADAVLQAGTERSRYLDGFGAGAAVSALEARLNLVARCSAAWCAGSTLVLRPRLDAARKRGVPPAMSTRPVALPEAYVVHSAGEGRQFGAGRRLMGWGPALSYSPSNRLFPDNGAVSPRREIPGKPMLFASGALAGGGQLTLLAADARAHDVDGRRIGGTFGAARAEWQQDGALTSSVGVVAGGGGALAPYLGMYAQRGLNDALTVGLEASVAHRYARPVLAVALAQNGGATRWDAIANLRYGLASGGELGLELIYNGYGLADAELGNPMVAALPSAGRDPGWNRPLHPLAQRRYALLQLSTPSLFGDKRWGLTARVLRGLDRSSTDSFVELSWSIGDALTLYGGHARSRVAPALALTRPVTRNAYLTLESYF